MLPLSDGPGEQPHPIIFSTPDTKHAMGVWSAQQPSKGFEQAGYGRFRFKTEKVVKWNCVFREKHAAWVPFGDYSYRCYVLVGSLKDVTDTMTSLEVADLLDSLEYTETGTYWKRTNPNGGAIEAIGFQSLEDLFTSFSDGEISGVLKEDPDSSGSVLPMPRNPSLIAAYLRVWHYLYHNHGELTERGARAGLMVPPEPPPVFNMVFQGGDSLGSKSGMHEIFSDERLTSRLSTPLRRAAHNDRGINQMRTGNSTTNPGGNRYIDLKVMRDPGNPHPEDSDAGRFRGYRYNRRPDEPGVIIGQAFDRDHLGLDCHKDHIPVSFMIDIPDGGPRFTLTS